MPEATEATQKDHDTLIEVRAIVGNLRDDLRRVIENMPSKDSVQRAHQRVDVLTRYLLGVAVFAAVEAFAIIKMVLLDKGH